MQETNASIVARHSCSSAVMEQSLPVASAAQDIRQHTATSACGLPLAATKFLVTANLDHQYMIFDTVNGN